MDINKWLESITTDTPAEISHRTGIPKRTLQHQIASGKMSVENLVKVGAAYNHHPIETLIEWGIIDQAWRAVPNIKAALKLAPEEWLADEVLSRMLRGVQTDQFTTPADELLERRSKQGTPDVEPERYVAKTKKPEPREGDDDYGPGA
ncbi:hypothetical protein [Corynebacterium flavescens]|uniref:hypothetical protein n=1 Tax=Corynebacterium flavescens TaxID=28028 RepID=UPI003FD4CBC8